MNAPSGYFHQFLPWNFITKFHEGVVIHKDGILQRTFAYRAPDTDSADALEINNIAVRINGFSKRLGSGWAFHFEAQRSQIRDYPSSPFDSLAPFLIDRERESAFLSSGRHFDSEYFITFSWKPPSENAQKLASLFVQSGEGREGAASVKQNVESFANETSSIAGLLAGNLLLAPLNNEETIAYLHSAVSFKRHPVRFPHSQIFLDRVLTDSALENSNPMNLGGLYIPIVGINDFPDETYPAILDSLNRARLEYRWVTRYICLDRDDGIKEARKKEKHHRGSRKSFLQTFMESTSGETAHAVNHAAGVKEQDSIDAGVEIDTDKAALGYLTTCVMVWDPDLKTARKKADAVKTIINRSGFTSKTETFNSLEAFKSMLPGNVYSNYHSYPVMSYNMSHIVPLSSVWAGFRSNAHALAATGIDTPHLICSTEEGTPFFLNLNVGDVGHSAVWGPTGAGKSTLLNLLEMQLFKYPGSQVIVFDKDRSCRQPCLSVGGLFYEPAAENQAGVNFQPLLFLETETDILNAVDFIEACIRVNHYDVTPSMSSAIKESLELLREKPQAARTITSFIQYANYQDPSTGRPALKEMLSDYLIDGGKYGKIFDSSASGISLNARFLAFEMASLMNRGDGCVVPALVCLFNLVERNFDGRLTMLVLDEAWLFLKNETFASKIAEWLKVLRKKNVYVVFATQEVADIAKSPLKSTVLQQCLTKIYLADPNAATPDMAGVYRSFGLTDAEISLISQSQMKKDYFYTSPAGRRLFQLDLGKITLALIGSPDHKLLDELVSRFEPGGPLCADILDRKGIPVPYFLGRNAPADPEPVPRAKPQARPQTQAAAPEPSPAPKPAPELSKFAELLEAVRTLPQRKNNDGSGRAAAAISKQFSVSQASVYQIRKILRHGSTELVQKLRNRDIPVKTAYKILAKESVQEAL
jgi:type IV secretion system protein VirB4